MTVRRKNNMPRINSIEKYENLWPLSWKLTTKKKREIEVIYKMGVLTATYKDSTIPFFKKDLTDSKHDRPLRLTTLDMLEHTGFRCGNPHP